MPDFNITSAVTFAITRNNRLKMFLKDVYSIRHYHWTKYSTQGEEAAQADVENVVDVGTSEYFPSKNNIWKANQKDQN